MSFLARSQIVKVAAVTRKKKSPNNIEELLKAVQGSFHTRKKNKITKAQKNYLNDAFNDEIFYGLLDKLLEFKPFIPHKNRDKFDSYIDEFKFSISKIESLSKKINEIKPVKDEIASKVKEIEARYNKIYYEKYNERAKLKQPLGYRVYKFINNSVLGHNYENEKILHLDSEIEKIKQASARSIFEIKERYYFEDTSYSASRIYELENELLKEYSTMRKKYQTARCYIYQEMVLAIDKKEKHDKKQMEKEAKNEVALKRIDAPSNVVYQLKKTQPLGSECPYCCRPLIAGEVHADHIHPVSQGGRSNFKNMVYICSQCNLNKSDLTLNMYIDKYNRDRNGIFLRLKTLGKNY